MSNKQASSNDDIEKAYLEFVKRRCANTNFHAEEKIKKIDELAEIVFEARKNYKNSKKIK